MLAELAHHHEDVFRGHLPVLLLISVIKIDCTDELVHRHAHQVRSGIHVGILPRVLKVFSVHAAGVRATCPLESQLESCSSPLVWLLVHFLKRKNYGLCSLAKNPQKVVHSCPTCMAQCMHADDHQPDLQHGGARPGGARGERHDGEVPCGGRGRVRAANGQFRPNVAGRDRHV